MKFLNVANEWYLSNWPEMLLNNLEDTKNEDSDIKNDHILLFDGEFPHIHTYLGIPGYVTKILSWDESTILVNKTGTNNQQLRGNLDRGFYQSGPG